MTNPHFPHFPIDIFIRLWYNIGVANEKEMKKMLMLKMIVLLALAMLVVMAAALVAAIEDFLEFLGSQDDDGEDEI